MMKFVFFLLLTVFVYAKDLQRNENLNIVIDKANKLIWQDDISVTKVKKTHKGATKYCNNLKFAGFTTWRLPSIEEFISITDKTNKGNHHINKVFKYNLPSGYWAKKAHWRTLWYYADYMLFISGTAYYDNRRKNKYVRCVKDIKD